MPIKQQQEELHDRFNCSEGNYTLLSSDRLLIEKVHNEYRASLMTGTAKYADSTQTAPQASNIHKTVSYTVRHLPTQMIQYSRTTNIIENSYRTVWYANTV